MLWLVAATMLLGSCARKPAVLEVELRGFEADTVYLYRVGNMLYNSILPQGMVRIPVTDGRALVPIDTLSEPTLLCLSPQNMFREYVDKMAYLFVEAQPMHVAASINRYGKLELRATGSALQTHFEAFNDAMGRAGHRDVLDSLEHQFYAARSNGDSVAMAAINDAIEPYFDEGMEQMQQVVDQSIAEHQNTLFGLYLYYMYSFQNHTFSTSDEIERVRAKLSGFDAQSKRNSIYAAMLADLERFAKCAVGAKAPEIQGIGLDGKPIRLSDFAGHYVLIDFWFTGCTWCYLEIPHLRRAYERYKAQGLVVLGVSRDRKEELWRQTIAREQANWPQLLLPPDMANALLESYCIIGFPHILLVDPDGIIVAKELRGEAILSSLEQHLGNSAVQ